MRPRHLALLLRLSLFVAIAACAALVVDYRSMGDPAFCSAGTGCGAVKGSGYSSIAGVPLPNLGLAAFACLLAGSLLARSRLHHLALAVAAGIGAIGAAALIVLQVFVLKAICVWCMAIDSSAIVGAAAAIGIALAAARADSPGGAPEAFAREVQPGGAALGAWVAAALLAIGLPFLWGMFPQPSLPAALAPLQAPGKITLISFTDFECPHCRGLSPELHRIAEEHGDRVHFVRKMVPLPRHKGALPAAKAYLCVPPEQREVAAARLYAAEPEHLTDAAMTVLLTAPGSMEAVKLDRTAFASCLAAPETQAQAEAERALFFEKAGGRGLPTTFVGRRMLLGNDPAGIREALALEMGGGRTELPLWLFFVVLGVIAAGAAAVSLRAPRLER